MSTCEAGDAAMDGLLVAAGGSARRSYKTTRNVGKLRPCGKVVRAARSSSGINERQVILKDPAEASRDARAVSAGSLARLGAGSTMRPLVVTAVERANRFATFRCHRRGRWHRPDDRPRRGSCRACSPSTRSLCRNRWCTARFGSVIGRRHEIRLRIMTPQGFSDLGSMGFRLGPFEAMPSG